MFKRIISTLLIVVLIIGTSLTASAASDSYSRVDVPGSETELRLSREMYSATNYITATSLGVSEKLDGITDIFSDKSGNILLLCGDKSRIVSINRDYTLDKEIVVTDESGEVVNYKGAMGIYKDDKGDIYISDTQNSRIIVTDSNGKVKNILATPESSLIPDDFLYQPVNVIKDKKGYTYILSLGCYYGALLYSPEDEFLGFYGASTVEANALDTLAYFWDKLTSNDVKKSNSTKKLPYSFADFCFDSEGYMITCTGSTSKNNYGTGQIRKISHNGSEIMYKRTLTGTSVDASTVNFLENERDDDYYAAQDLVAVATSEDDYIYALDRTNGIVYIFDYECNLLSAFGGGYGSGTQIGTFVTPVSLSISRDDVLVADAGNGSITVFKATEYGKLLRNAQTLYLNDDYDKAAEVWEKVLDLNRNCQLAYRGLAMVYYNQGDYKAALDAAKIAVDYSVYDMAWKQIVSQFLTDNFVWISVLFLIVVATVIYLIVYFKKKNKHLITNQKLLLMMKTPFHPFETFDDLKYKKLGSMKIAIIITVLFYVSSVLNVISAGFLYQNTLLRNYNALFTLASTAGLVVLWSVCNWLVCSMFDGKGYFSEVFISTTYTLVPLTLFYFLKAVLSNFLPLSTTGLISGIETAIVIYTLFMLCIAMLKVHEYDFFKFLLTTIVVIFFMILVVFIILMGAILVKQLWTFLVSVYEEVVYR